MAEQSSKAPRLTIVIPTLNRAHCIGRAVDSALSQTFPDIEIIVSNNGSTDSTREILERYHDPRLRIYHHERTIPIREHGSFLLEQARGEYYLFLSDDDYLEADFSKLVIELFDRYGDLSFVYTNCMKHFDDQSASCPLAPEVERSGEFLAAYLAGQREVFWCACVIRTQDLREIGQVPDEVVLGDLYYWVKLASKGRVGFVSKIVSHYTFMGVNGTMDCPVVVWAEDARRFTDEMVDSYIRQEKPDKYLENKVRLAGAGFLSRVTANQFLWCALGGFKKSVLIRDLFKVYPYVLKGEKGTWFRVVAALVLPRALLRRVILWSVRYRSRGTEEKV